MSDAERPDVVLRTSAGAKVRWPRVVLVRPPMQMALANHVTLACPPLGAAYLAAALRAVGAPVSIVDAVGEAPFRSEPFGERFTRVGLSDDEIVARIPEDAGLVGVSVMFSEEWPLVRRTIQAIHRARPSAPIVVGGEHASALPELVLAECPGVVACAIGEGEETLVEVARALAEGRPLTAVAGLALRAPGRAARTPRRARIRALDGIARPAWDLVPLETYLAHGLGYGVRRGRSVPLLATRGCPYQCTFCSSPTMWTTRWAARAPEDVIAEMTDAVRDYGAANFDLYDLTAVIRGDWILRFASLVVERGLRVTWQIPAGTRSEAIDRAVAEQLHRAGCRNVAYAPESGSPSLLARVKKRVSLPRMKQSMREALAAGLSVKANLVMGFPDETRGEAEETVALCRELAELGIHDVNVTPFTPYPGSALFEQLRADGRLGPIDDAFFAKLATYSDLARSESFSAHLSSRELQALRWRGMAEFYARSFARRPGRAVDRARSFLTGREETRLDKSLTDLATRHAPTRAVVRAIRAGLR